MLSGYTHRIALTPIAPASTRTNWTFSVTPSLFPIDYWNIVKAAGADVRFALANDTELPVYPFRHDSGGTTGNYFGKHTITTTPDTIYCYFGNPSASAYGVSDPFGQYACFDSTIRAFYPDGLGNDATSFLNHLTPAGGYTVGDADGPYSGAKATTLDGTTQYGVSGVSVPTGTPLYLSVMGRPANDTVTANTVLIQNSATDSDLLGIVFGGAIGGNPIQVIAASGGVFSGVNTTTGYTANTYYHASASFIASNSRIVWINGTSPATSANNRLPVGINRITIGGHAGTTTAAQYAGRLALTQVHTNQRSQDHAAYETAMYSNQATFWDVGDIEDLTVRGISRKNFSFGMGM